MQSLNMGSICPGYRRRVRANGDGKLAVTSLGRGWLTLIPATQNLLSISTHPDHMGKIRGNSQTQIKAGPDRCASPWASRIEDHLGQRVRRSAYTIFPLLLEPGAG